MWGKRNSSAFANILCLEDIFEINLDAFGFDGLVGEFFFAVFGGNEDWVGKWKGYFSAVAVLVFAGLAVK